MRIFLPILLCLCAILPVFGDEPTFEVVATGIAPNSDNRCVLRDRYGFLWVGSSPGLECYDGNEVAVYGNNSAALGDLSNVAVSALFENGDDIWIGGDFGLYVFNRDRNAAFRFPFKTKYGVSVSALVEKVVDAGLDCAWICTQGQGFFIFNRADSTLMQDSRHGSFYSDIVLGANGLVYLAEISGRIQAFNPDGKFVGEVRLPDYVSDKNQIRMVASGRDIWIASGRALYKFEEDTNTIRRIDAQDMTGMISALLTRPDGTLLICTNTGMWSYSTIQGSMTRVALTALGTKYDRDNRVVDAVVDANGDIILVRPNRPIDVVVTRPRAFTFVPLPKKSKDLVHAVAGDVNGGGLWVGSARGLDYYDFASGGFLPVKGARIGPCDVTSLTPDGTKLWVGTRTGGLILYDTATGDVTNFVYDDHIPYTVISNEINDVYCTSEGDTYVLTNWGVCRYDATHRNFPQLPEFGQQIHATTMQEDNDGGIWVATSNNGLYYRRPGEDRFNQVEGCENIGTVPVTELHLDKVGRLWAATLNKGIFVYDREAREFVPVEIPALDGHPVTVITEDNNGRLWFGAEKTLVGLTTSDADYGLNIHVQTLPMEVGATVDEMADGTVAIGSLDGFMVFEPSKIKSYENRVKVYPCTLTFPHINDAGNSVNAPDMGGLLYMRREVEVPYENNSFTIHLAATRPLAESYVSYDYMLKGIDKGWNSGTTVPEVTYNNLPPGDYEFMLRAHGLKDAEVTKLAVSVLPPWYRSSWAMAGYIIMLVLASYGFYLLTRMMVRRNFQRRLKEMHIQKERETFEAKTRYFVDLVHEIRTPLMLISMPLEQLAEGAQTMELEKSDKEKADRYIKSMQQNIDYLLGITNQLLDFRRVENQSEIRLNLTRCNLAAMIRNILQRFDEPLKISGKTIETELPDHEVWVTIDVDKTERMLMNLIGNAMKYADSHIWVTLEDMSDDAVVISVADDGPGIPVEERGKIFDTYYQIVSDKVAASLGTGLGLAYAKLIANAHNGNIDVEDTFSGKGAKFSITLPKGDDIFVSNQIEISEFSDNAAQTVAQNQDVNVLLVEDNDDLRNLITESLGRHYSVINATNGNVALDLLASNKIDIIISDVMMEGMDGLELCRRVKGDINFSHIPFIMLTAMTGADAHEKGLQSGADVYLEKPFPIR